MTKHIHIDPFNGIAGDMLLSALVHLGAPRAEIESAVNSALSSLQLRVGLHFEEISSHAIDGLRLKVVPETPVSWKSLSYSRLCSLLDAAPLPKNVADLAAGALELVGIAEAKAHGVLLSDVHFHEIGGVDSIVDFIGVPMALHFLGATSVSCSPPPLGGGRIKCAHGILPSPAPATLLILKGMEVAATDVEAELTTPTGAALAKSMCREFSPPPKMVLQAVGGGFGAMEFNDRPNCLRLFLGDVSTENGINRERLFHLETNIDDMSPELLGALIEICLEAGALDAWLSPVLMKKGRPAHVLNALCSHRVVPALKEAVFRSSSTMGVRMAEVNRDSLPRGYAEIETPWGKVRVKQGFLEGSAVVNSPEFEDCRSVAAKGGASVKDVYNYALAAALYEKMKPES